MAHIIYIKSHCVSPIVDIQISTLANYLYPHIFHFLHVLYILNLNSAEVSTSTIDIQVKQTVFRLKTTVGVKRACSKIYIVTTLNILDAEKEIYIAQALESGKSEEIAEKMVAGRLNKFLAENSLLQQPFVKNPDTTVGELVSAEGASVVSFVRYEVGEGIEIEEVDFAAEVAAQLNH